jgi:hypothetical protein
MAVPLPVPTGAVAVPFSAIPAVVVPVAVAITPAVPIPPPGVILLGLWRDDLGRGAAAGVVTPTLPRSVWPGLLDQSLRGRATPRLPSVLATGASGALRGGLLSLAFGTTAIPTSLALGRIADDTALRGARAGDTAAAPGLG